MMLKSEKKLEKQDWVKNFLKKQNLDFIMKMLEKSIPN